MIVLLAAGAAIASALAYAAALAFSTRLWPSLGVVAIGLLLVLAFGVLGALATMPSDALQRGLSNASVAEAYAMVVCLEALIAAGALWYSTASDAYLRNTMLLVPLPVTIAALLALAQFSMVYGPRIDLELLGWVGLLLGLAVVAAVAMGARWVAARTSDFVLELCLLLRLLAVLFVTAMISIQFHRPTPVLDFEPAGLLIFAIISMGFVLYGYFRRPQY